MRVPVKAVPEGVVPPHVAVLAAGQQLVGSDVGCDAQRLAEHQEGVAHEQGHLHFARVWCKICVMAFPVSEVLFDRGICGQRGLRTCPLFPLVDILKRKVGLVVLREIASPPGGTCESQISDSGGGKAHKVFCPLAICRNSKGWTVTIAQHELLSGPISVHHGSDCMGRVLLS